MGRRRIKKQCTSCGFSHSASRDTKCPPSEEDTATEGAESPEKQGTPKPPKMTTLAEGMESGATPPLEFDLPPPSWRENEIRLERRMNIRIDILEGLVTQVVSSMAGIKDRQGVSARVWGWLQTSIVPY